VLTARLLTGGAAGLLDRDSGNISFSATHTKLYSISKSALVGQHGRSWIAVQ
jgi:hypothetical protein